MRLPERTVYGGRLVIWIAVFALGFWGAQTAPVTPIEKRRRDYLTELAKLNADLAGIREFKRVNGYIPGCALF